MHKRNIKPIITVFLLTITFLFWADYALGAVPPWKLLGQTKLSNDNVSSLAIDKDGFLWIGTSNGLNRFNGSTYRHFLCTDSTSLSSSNIYSLAIDSQNRIWVGVIGGIELIEDGQVRKTTKPGFNPPFSIVDVDEQTLLYGGILGIFKYDKTNHTEEQLTAFPNEEFSKVAYSQSTSDVAAISRYGNTLYIGKINSCSKQTAIELSNNSTVRDLVFVASDLYLATSDGLIKYHKHGDKWEQAKLPSSLARITDRQNISLLLKKDDSHIVLATPEVGLIEYGLVSNHIISTLQSEDNWKVVSHAIGIYYDDGLFLSKDNNGFEYCSRDPFSKVLISTSKDIGQPTKLQLCKDGRHLILVCNNSVLLVDKRGNSFKDITPSQLRTNDDISVGLIDNNCNLWSFTNNETLRKFTFSGDGYLQHSDYNVPKSECIWDSADNEVKVLTNNGFATIKENGTLVEETVNNINDYTIWYGKTLKDGTSIVSTLEGKTLMLSGGNLVDCHFCPNQSIDKIIEASNGDTWYSVLGKGVYHYIPQTGETIQYSMSNGLPSNNIMSLNEDCSGRIWITTDDKLIFISPSDNRIGLSQNIVSHHFNNAIIDQDNNILCISSNNLIRINSEALVSSQSNIHHGLTIDAIEASGKWHNKQNEPIVLSHKDVPLSIYFSQTDISGRNRMSYIYKMEGIDKDWVHAGNLERVGYSKLKRGKHTFYLKLVDPTGNISHEYISQAFIKKAHPLLSIVALTIYLLLSTTVLTMLIHLTIRNRRNREKLIFAQNEKRLSEKMNQEKIDFFTNISHEYRTPLTLIYGPAKELQQRNDIPSDAKEKIRLINSNADRLLSLSGQLLNFNKDVNPEMTLKARKHNVVKMLKDLVSDVQYLTEQKGQSLSLTIDENNSTLLYDSDKVDKILFNLLTNAIKYTEQGGHIWINESVRDYHFIRENYSIEDFTANDGTTYNGNYLEIVVTDDGTGIPKDKADKLFGRFQRLVDKNDKNSAEGFGIGLNLSMNLAKICNGTIEHKPNKPKGSIMALIVPIDMQAFTSDQLWIDIPENSIADIEPDNPIKDTITASANSQEGEAIESGPNVLIVEDNSQLRAYLKDIFNKGGYRAFTAIDGEDALQILNDLDFQIVISDVVMPRRNGYELCNTIKSTLDFCHIPVVLLTAIGSTESQLKGLEYGADAYIKKPFDNNILLSTVDSIIKNRARLRKVYSESLPVGSENTIESQDNQEHAISLNPLDEKFINKLVDLMNTEISNENFNLADLYVEMGMSRSSFYNKVKALTGLSPQQYMTSFRMNKALEMLKSQKYRVGDVVYEVGFSTIAGFSKAFKKHFGYPPSSVK